VTEPVGDGPLLRLEEFLPYRLAVLSSAVSRAVAPVYTRHGLNLGEWLVLMSLGEFGPMTAKAVGARNRMHKTKVSRALAALVERGVIERAPNRVDLRQSFLSLTPSGKRLYEDYAPRIAEVARRLQDAVPAADRAALERCLTKLAARSEELMSGLPRSGT